MIFSVVSPVTIDASRRMQMIVGWLSASRKPEGSETRELGRGGDVTGNWLTSFGGEFRRESIVHPESEKMNIFNSQNPWKIFDSITWNPLLHPNRKKN